MWEEIKNKKILVGVRGITPEEVVIASKREQLSGRGCFRDLRKFVIHHLATALTVFHL